MLRESSTGASLSELSWLVGTWNFGGEEGEATLKFAPIQNKTFMSSSFELKTKAQTVTGFQIIGVDPETRGLKSWSFEGDGTIGSAMWGRTEKGWIAKSTATNSDGDVIVGTITLIPVDANTFEWKITERMIGDEKLPDVGPIKVTRKE